MSYEPNGRAPAEVRRASADAARRLFRIPEPVRPLVGEGRRLSGADELSGDDAAARGRALLRRTGFNVIAPASAGPERFDAADAADPTFTETESP